jgi:hypothetical protein
MQGKPTFPTWPEMAESIARMHLDAKRLLEDAISEGNKAEISGCRRLVRDTQKLMDKYGITIRA